MPDGVVSVIVLCNQRLEHTKDGLEMLSEELGLDFCDLIEFN